jgi:hypothetical protein
MSSSQARPPASYSPQLLYGRLSLEPLMAALSISTRLPDGESSIFGAAPVLVFVLVNGIEEHLERLDVLRIRSVRNRDGAVELGRKLHVKQRDGCFRCYHQLHNDK